MTGIPLIIVFILTIVLMIFMISKLNIHPFLSILSVSLVFGLIAGIPLVDQTAEDGTVVAGIANVIGEGFSGAFTSIGIVIILGTIIGALLEETGAALKLADMVVNLVGEKRPELAMLIMGWVVSIPVFCDSGFVILNPIRKALTKRTSASSVAMTMCLSAGLYASHVFIPPTPGPIAAANTIGVGSDLLLVMGLGLLVSIPALAGAYFYSKRQSVNIEELVEDDNLKTYEEIKAEYGTLPGGFLSLAPIIIPVILMALSNIFKIMKAEGFINDLFLFLGTPIIALAVGLIFGIILLNNRGKIDHLYEIVNESLKVAGPILFVTAAGGVLGKVIANSGIVGFITDNATVFQSIGIFFPFIIAAILKTAQGSSTVAITTTAGIIAPLLPVLGLDSTVSSALVVMAIGAGAMTVSHANDSYFWVVTKFGGLRAEDGYKTQTMVTLVEGICGMLGVFILSLFLH
ncbi:GntP family permease [Anaerococcus provencensis]|uniref:GntP family permease n=1 Tax=Anaerococcus provencensis TaxID=938293 RepID=UPI0002DD60EE|nr:GntP family permease [Anaerococcus provencensis]